MQRHVLAAAVVTAALTLAGCWGDDNSTDPVPQVGPPMPITEVPDTAGVNGASLFSFILGLGMNDETSQPLTIRDSFAVPADESSEPTPLP